MHPCVNDTSGGCRGNAQRNCWKEFQVGIEPTTSITPDKFSNHWASRTPGELRLHCVLVGQLLEQPTCKSKISFGNSFTRCQTTTTHLINTQVHSTPSLSKDNRAGNCTFSWFCQSDKARTKFEQEGGGGSSQAFLFRYICSKEEGPNVILTLTSAMSVKCSISWTIMPTGSWPLCRLNTCRW